MSVQIVRRQFNVTEYYRMMDAGILSESDHVELIDGEVIQMNPIGSRHAGCVNILTELLGDVENTILAVQNPIRLDEFSEPQPDLTLLQKRDDYYRTAHPTAKDVLLVVEVSDSSADVDQLVKLPLYAEAGISEFWLVNLLDNKIEMYSHPANGTYQKSQEFKRGAQFASDTIPGLSLSVDSILG